MDLYVFDIDGTLTPPRQPMEESFAEKFEKWMEDHSFSLISGSDIVKILEQIPMSIAARADRVFASSGNDVWQNGLQLHTNKVEFSQSLIDFLLFELKYSSWGTKTDNHFEYRPGMLNFSVVGRSANLDMRKAYNEWDTHDGERKRIVNYINERFPDYEASIGGEISVDITKRGSNKSQLLTHYDLKETIVHFYGDKCQYGQNDYPICKAIDDLGCGYWYQVNPKILEETLLKKETNE